MKKLLTLLLLALVVSGAWARSEAELAAAMANGARHLLASLSAEQRTKATFPLLDDERYDWHYIPRARPGVPFKTMTPAQRKLAHALLGTALSGEGYRKAAEVMFLDQILYEQQGRNPVRDADAYYFTFFGVPSERRAWGWRLEGHHLSLNFTLQRDGGISTTPSFFGANPATVRKGPHQGLRVLAAEEQMGRRLLGLFKGAERKKVVINTRAPRDIITGTSRKAELSKPEGVAVAEMTEEQAQLLLDLIEVYARRSPPELAEAELAQIRKAGLEKVHFAWAGGSEPGHPHYYRIHGPTFVIEYDNTQDNANHIHTVWRSFEGDFGLDLLRQHYARSSHHAQERPSAAPR